MFVAAAAAAGAFGLCLDHQITADRQQSARALQELIQEEQVTINTFRELLELVTERKISIEEGQVRARETCARMPETAQALEAIAKQEGAPGKAKLLRQLADSYRERHRIFTEWSGLMFDGQIEEARPLEKKMVTNWRAWFRLQLRLEELSEMPESRLNSLRKAAGLKNNDSAQTLEPQAKTSTQVSGQL